MQQHYSTTALGHYCTSSTRLSSSRCRPTAWLSSVACLDTSAASLASVAALCLLASNSPARFTASALASAAVRSRLTRSCYVGRPRRVEARRGGGGGGEAGGEGGGVIVFVLVYVWGIDLTPPRIHGALLCPTEPVPSEPSLHPCLCRCWRETHRFLVSSTAAFCLVRAYSVCVCFYFYRLG